MKSPYDTGSGDSLQVGGLNTLTVVENLLNYLELESQIPEL